jgi:hypothetical protein
MLESARMMSATSEKRRMSVPFIDSFTTQPHGRGEKALARSVAFRLGPEPGDDNTSEADQGHQAPVRERSATEKPLPEVVSSHCV